MLAFKRFASSTAHKRELQEFFTYHTTKAELKPWIYRPKNANILLTMDLKDPETNAPLKPRSPVQPLSRKVLDQYVNSIEPNSRELVDWLRGWTDVSIRKRELWNYISSGHLQNMLMQSFFKIGSYASLVNTLYSRQKKFVEAKNQDAFDVERFFNTIIACNLHRNHELGYKTGDVALRKLETAWNHVTHRDNETGLANSLIGALVKQQGITNVPKLKGLSAKPINLPSLPENDSRGNTAASINEQKFTYMIARTVLEFDPEADQAIKTFVKAYQARLKELGKEDVYENNVAIMKQNFAAIKAKEAKGDTAQAEAQSEEESPESKA
ncbi:hypothetical protein ZYGR_0I07450 [Zygosaccharomyces rouxii]|uniref:ZYRO0C17622p n=2 Tax=Zygosaccharomyces rouxii TaxID=4956 RepID=C5DUK9_ZYGRC|nr:uncharacterized protein ZYRO0C17622g [Zygosaccharomyces rouxii]KAH9201359.1 hypothetical protein LQ764DRAFT_233193 [Zygosaccharomyces rouxii]GAV48448.1 hypothetical protein ZYGR_0I07450 [Zygosaccharomyces rouxii]CAR27470.1 ZYRO0C17622p [Zygosaccharomyces rouxii]